MALSFSGCGLHFISCLLCFSRLEPIKCTWAAWTTCPEVVVQFIISRGMSRQVRSEVWGQARGCHSAALCSSDSRRQCCTASHQLAAVVASKAFPFCYHHLPSPSLDAVPYLSTYIQAHLEHLAPRECIKQTLQHGHNVTHITPPTVPRSTARTPHSHHRTQPTVVL